MQLEKLRNEIIFAKEARWEYLEKLIKHNRSEFSFVTVSINMPGAEKSDSLTRDMCEWAGVNFSLKTGVKLIKVIEDKLGMIQFYSSQKLPVALKKTAIQIETSHNFARLIDIDIYDRTGRQVDRKEIFFPPRPCLLCESSAQDCIRTNAHDYKEVVTKARNLLQNFREYSVSC
jgi:holo-ACP synthase CitX